MSDPRGSWTEGAWSPPSFYSGVGKCIRTCYEPQAFLGVWSSLVLYCLTPLMTVGDNGLYSRLNHVCFNRGLPAQLAVMIDGAV